jgi:2-methylfumaryl-CoA isomerase
MCVSALLAAERHRLRGKGGQEVEIALKDVAAATLGHLGMIADAMLNGTDRAKAGNALYGAYGQDFLCADGRRVMVIGLTRRQWRGLVAATGTAEDMAALERALGVSLEDEGARWTHRAKITEVLAAWFAARSVPDFADDFNARGLTWSEFRSVREALAHDPDLGPENPLFSQVAHPGLGPVLTPSHPGKFSAMPPRPAAPPPVLGANTEEVLADVVGLGSGAIGRLFDKGIVEGPVTRPAVPAA